MARRIVFIVGAGASAEFDLPIGSSLVARIADMTKFEFNHHGEVRRGDAELYLAAEMQVKDVPPIARTSTAQEAKKLSSSLSLAPSIDHYLYSHRSRLMRTVVGKTAIAKVIGDAERRSKLFWEPPNAYDEFNFGSISSTWLSSLFRIMVTAGDLNSFKLDLDRFSFIVFNYDRVVERFFFLALKHYFELRPEYAERICAEHLDIHHPYGTIGDLISADRDSGFGSDLRARDLVVAASSVRTFGEGGNSATQSIARHRITKADCLIFLGFSFLDINMRYLAPNHHSSFDRIIGTAFGVSMDNLLAAREFLMVNVLGARDDERFFFQPTFAKQLIDDFSSYIGSR